MNNLNTSLPIQWHQHTFFISVESILILSSQLGLKNIEYSQITVMKIINTNSSNENTFRYSILCSIHYYDINHHPERITKLKSFENKYNFTHNAPNKFEINNPNMSLRIFDENNEIIYTSSNNSTNTGNIVRINNHRYAAIKTTKNKSIKLNELTQSHCHHELRDYLFEIFFEKIDNINSIAGEIISPILFY